MTCCILSFWGVVYRTADRDATTFRRPARRGGSAALHAVGPSAQALGGALRSKHTATIRPSAALMSFGTSQFCDPEASNGGNRSPQVPQR